MTTDWVAATGTRTGVDIAARVPAGPSAPRQPRAAEPAALMERPGRPSRTPVRLIPPAGDEAELDLWVPLGPHVYLRGQASYRPRVSGRVRAIAVSDAGSRVYAATAQGGVWFSGDRGNHWLPLDFYATTRTTTGVIGEANALAVGSIAVRFGSATDGSQDDVFVGTGEQKFVYDTPSSFPRNMQGVGIRHAKGPAKTVADNGITADPWILEATSLAGAAVLRIAADQLSGEVVAATTRGLFRRPRSGSADTWEQLDTPLEPTDIQDITITAGEPGQPRRLWVSSKKPGLAFAPLTDLDDFTEVELPHNAPLTAEGAEVTMTALAGGGATDHAVVYLLADGPRLWRASDRTAHPVENIPRDLFGSQASYDMAIAVKPGDDNVILLGGSGVEVPQSFDAALYLGGVHQRSTGDFGFLEKTRDGDLPIGFVGLGVHSDVHDLSWIPGGGGGPEVWVACDGGVFRSAPSADVGRFRACNSGIGSIEAQYIAQHPTSDAVLLVGTQDTGGIRPVSPEAWTLATFGDGGGAAIHPTNPRLQFIEYTESDWLRSLDGGRTFEDVTLFSKPPAGSSADVIKKFTTMYADEHDHGSPPYCSAAVIANGDTIQLAVATDRVWYSEDWGANWVTLPSGKNPYDPTSVPAAPDRMHDRMADRGIGFALKWAKPNTLLVAYQDGIYLYSRASAPGSPWTRTRRYNRPQALRDSGKKGNPPDGQIRADMPITDIASHDPNRAGLGSLYAATSGENDDHVWWFDGEGHWLRTGFPVDVPVHALSVDPVSPEIVYAGTDIGVWKGVGAIPGPGSGTPTWAWKQYSNGLPEAACIDLVIHPVARLLRAALRGRGVWEVRLDGGRQQREAYVRAHSYDTRRRLPLPSFDLDPLPADPAKPEILRLDASPDLKVYRGVGTEPPPFGGLSYDRFAVWAIQCGLLTMGKRLDPSGDFDLWTRSANAEVSPLPATAPEWRNRLAGPNANTPPFDHDPPDAADINVTLLEEPDRRTPPKTSCATGSGLARVFAVVHNRDVHPLAAGEVAVFVLRTKFKGRADLIGQAELPANWPQRLRDDLTAAHPGGWLTGSDWAYLDPVKPFRRPLRPVDQREAQVVELDVPATAWPTGDWLLLAVIVADQDPIATTERDPNILIRSSRHVAARSVHRVDP